MYYLINLINGTLYWLKQLDIFINYMCTLVSVIKGAFTGMVTYRQPSEISLFHNGVLFQVKLPGFKQGVLEVFDNLFKTRKWQIQGHALWCLFPSIGNIIV
jgi:hypothetical protein